MDEHDDRDQANPGESPLFRSGRVRIVGAEPVRSVGDLGDPSSGPDGEPAGEGGDLPPEPEPDHGGDDLGEAAMPHWTDAPTGEVPAVLARSNVDDDQGRDPWAALPSPTWREEHTDWQAGEETFEPSMLAQDELRIGALDESGLSDRQPWSFDLDEDEPEVWSGTADEDTVVGPAVRVIGEPSAGGPDDVSRDAWPRGTAPRGADARPLSLRERLALEGEGAEGEGRVAKEGTRRTDEQVEPEAAHGTLDEAGEPVGPGEVGTEEVDGGVDERRPRRTARHGRPGGARTARPPVGRQVPPVVSTPSSTRHQSRPRAGAVASGVNGSGVGTGARTQPPPSARSGRDLPLAIVTGLVLGAVALICFKIGTVASLVVVTVVVALAAMEALAALRRAGHQPATLLGLVAVVSVMVAAYNKGQVAVPLVTVLLVAFVALWHLAGVERGADPLRSTASTLLVFCWIGVFGSYGALLLDPSLFPARHGIAFLLGAVIAGVACDVGALAVGSTMGSHPLAPSISPNKTWEGVIGGLVASVLVSVVVVHFIHPWTAPKAAVLGVVVAIVSPIGDLTESLVKRQLGLKDMGRLLPGHGGILDRVDGLLFVLPATFYLVKALHLG